MATFTQDGSVQLRYDDAIVFETSTGGIDIPDDKKLQFGAGQDLQIYHDSSNNVSFISESGASDFIQRWKYCSKITMIMMITLSV